MKSLQAVLGVGTLVCAVVALAGLAGCGGASNGAAPPGAAVSASSVATVAPEMIGTSNQDAVYHECFYALRSSEITDTTGTTGPTTGMSKQGYTVSDWNYLASGSTTVFNNLVTLFKTKYETPGPVWVLPPPPSVSPYFGLTKNYAVHSGYGRGGQSLFFVALILQRSRKYAFPNNWIAAGSLTGGPYDGYATTAVPGDIIINTVTKEAAVVVEMKFSVLPPRKFVGLDVVDSNWSGLNGSVGGAAGNPEIICRHVIANATLADPNWLKISGRGRWW